MERPKDVKLSVRLMWLSLVLMLVTAPFAATIKTAGAAIASTGVTVIFLAFLFYMVWRGRNWARIIFLVMFLFGLIPVVLYSMHSLTTAPLLVASSMIQTMLQAAATYMLFTAAAKPWFQKKAD